MLVKGPSFGWCCGETSDPKAESLTLNHKARTSGLSERGLVWLREQSRGARSVPRASREGTMFLQTLMGSAIHESMPCCRSWDVEVIQPLAALGLARRGTEELGDARQLPAYFGFTVLHRGAARGKKIDSDTPAEWKALVNVQDVTGWTPIFYTCAAKNSDMVCQLLDLGADATLADIHGYTVAHHACLSECVDILTTLSRRSIDLEAQAINGAKPIHLAAGRGLDEVISHVYELQQRNPSAKRSEKVPLDFNGRTPMHWAAARGHVQAFKALKGNVNDQDNFGWSSLHIAVLARKKHLISTLHQLSADVERTDRYCRTPLVLACLGKRWEVIGELVGIGAKVYAAGSNDMTPLHYVATQSGYMDRRDSKTAISILTKDLGPEAIRLLTELRNRGGHTPLHLAAINGRIDVINKLLKLGADANSVSSRGESPLVLAITHAKKSMVALSMARVLVRGGAELGVKSVDGRSP